MKRTISILLALVMVLALSIAAFADYTPNGNTTQEVTATYNAGTSGEPGTVYYVTVAWQQDSNDLTYTDGTAAYRWDPETLTYVSADEGGTAPGWTGSAKYTVTVTNKSNAAVMAQTSWQGNEGITADCSYEDGDTVALGSAAEGVTPGSGAEGEEQTERITAEIKVLDGSIASSGAIGTLTVTIITD